MLVKRTILKIHLLSLCTLEPILSTLSSSEHRQQGQSMQDHLRNALCHILDPLRNIFFSIMIGPETDFNSFYRFQDGQQFLFSADTVGVGNGSPKGTQNRNYRVPPFFFSFFFAFFFFEKLFSNLP